MSHEHKHHRSDKSASEPQVHLDSNRIHYHGRIYEWEGDDQPYYNKQRKWYRVSTHYILRDGKKVPWVPENKRIEMELLAGDPMHDVAWEDVRYHLKGLNRKELIGRLNHCVEKAEDEKDRLDRVTERAVMKQRQRQEKEQRKREKAHEEQLEELKQFRELVLDQEQAEIAARAPEADSASASEAPARETSWERHKRPRRSGQRIERTKYGVRVWTADGKTWWDICVNESTAYPGCTAVRVTLPPPRRDQKRWHMAVFDLETMEAIRREFSRGTKSKKAV